MATWGEEFERLKEADREGALDAENLERLAEAALWTGRVDELLSARQRAFGKYIERGDTAAAAQVALELVTDHVRRLESSLASGWLRRAEGLLDGQPESRAHGYLQYRYATKAFGVGALDDAIVHADDAVAIAQRFGDRNLEALALHVKGTVLVYKGDLGEGLGVLDEVNARAVAGELEPTATAIVYCNTISVCQELADYGRAGEWTERVTAWCGEQAIEGFTGFPGVCRVHRAGVLRMRGDWNEAEAEVRRACDELEGFNLVAAAEGFYELGELRLRLGDTAGAEEAFLQAHELGRDPQPGLAALRLLQGRADSARACLDRSFADESAGPLERVRLLPMYVEICIAAGDLEAAAEAAEELARIAATYETPALRAAALEAAGRVALARSELVKAVADTGRASKIWREIGLPYESARARLVLGQAHEAAADHDAAVLELRAARSAFERLGASTDARRAAALLGAHEGEPARESRTFVFTDMCSSTTLVEAIGDRAWHDLIDWHDRTLRTLFAEHRGEEIDHAGDGFFVAFRDAADAISCAISVQRALAAHRREHGFAPQVRIGVHRADATSSGAGYKGRGVHVAARIGAVAEGGEILVSTDTLADDGSVSCSDAREITLKGISSPVEVASIDWRGGQ